MLAFSFQTVIADIDQTIEREPEHPALVLILEMDEDFIRIIVPNDVLSERRELLKVDETVRVVGSVRDSTYGLRHVATRLDLLTELR